MHEGIAIPYKEILWSTYILPWNYFHVTDHNHIRDSHHENMILKITLKKQTNKKKTTQSNAENGEQRIWETLKIFSGIIRD